jgi:hypothetical protein
MRAKLEGVPISGGKTIVSVPLIVVVRQSDMPLSHITALLGSQQPAAKVVELSKKEEKERAGDATGATGVPTFAATRSVLPLPESHRTSEGLNQVAPSPGKEEAPKVLARPLRSSKTKVRAAAAMLAGMAVVVMAVFVGLWPHKTQDGPPIGKDMLLKQRAEELWQSRQFDQSEQVWQGLAKNQGPLQNEASQQVSQIEQKRADEQRRFEDAETLLKDKKDSAGAQQALQDVIAMNLWHSDDASRELEAMKERSREMEAHNQGRGSWAAGPSITLCPLVKALQTAYPFNAQSAREITLPEFSSFFQPVKGTLSQFIASQKNNLSLEGTAFVPALGTPTKIGPNFLRTLNELYAIQQAVYPNNAADPRFEYSVTTQLPRAGGFKRGKLMFDGQEWDLSGSGGTRKFLWPGATVQGASLSLNSGTDLEVARYGGLWAVSHFLSAYTWQSSGTDYIIQGPLIGPTGQSFTSSGKAVEVRFHVDFKGVRLFQAGFLSGYSCGPMSK